VFDIRLKSQSELEDMLLDRDVVKFVKSSLNGKDYGAPVVVTDSEPSLEI
jgi:hypothetical protein